MYNSIIDIQRQSISIKTLLWLVSAEYSFNKDELQMMAIGNTSKIQVRKIISTNKFNRPLLNPFKSKENGEKNASTAMKCTPPASAPPCHLRIAYSPRATNEFQVNETISFPLRAAFMNGLLLRLTHAVHTAHGASTGWLTDWALSSTPIFSFFLCLSFVEADLSIVDVGVSDWCAAILNSLRTNTCKKRYAHTHIQLCVFVRVLCTHAIHQSPIQQCTHTRTQQARSSQFQLCQKQTYVCINLLFRSYCFISFIIVVHIKCRWRWWLCGDVIRWIKHTRSEVNFKQIKKFCASRFGVLQELACVFVSRQTKRQHRPIKTNENK